MEQIWCHEHFERFFAGVGQLMLTGDSCSGESSPVKVLTIPCIKSGVYALRFVPVNTYIPCEYQQLGIFVNKLIVSDDRQPTFMITCPQYAIYVYGEINASDIPTLLIEIPFGTEIDFLHEHETRKFTSENLSYFVIDEYKEQANEHVTRDN